MTPEAKAREIIDKKLIECGYVVQDFLELNLNAGKGVVIREYQTDSGPVDYLIFINKRPVGIIEAKKEKEGFHLVTDVENQTFRYRTSKLKFFEDDGQVQIRFSYETTGSIIRFTDFNDEEYCSREIFNFHTPDELEEFLSDTSTLRNRMKHFPLFLPNGFRDCQVNAIKNLESSFSRNMRRALIQMATGAGKTYTAITSIYRLLKYSKAKRILFLVDTKNLGKQAMDEFTAYKPADSNKTFTELYNVTHMKSSYVPASSNVVICTIQRLYSMLRGEELDESLEEEPIPNADIKEIQFNKKYPISFFDFVFIDECHRSIYNLWKQVLDYFDWFQIGLTATPDKRTFGYFNENVVSEYSREQAIIDGVNVGEDEYIIETKVSKEGAKIKAQRVIRKRERLTRKERWESLDEDIVYSSSDLDKGIVNLSQIRNVIKAFKEAVEKVCYPERKEFPKTLIFAKSDSHADDIIKIVREEFGKGNEFCKKITYRAEGNPNDEIKSFRNDYKFRVAVTVDMIATGTDIKPLECLLFMRDVKSKNYYEQMKGRGTRVIEFEDLKKVSPSALHNKERFVLFDAVGVTKSEKTEGRTLERQPNVSLKELMTKIALGNREEDVITTVAGRLLRLERIIDDKEKNKILNLTNGKSLSNISSDLLNSFDIDYIQKIARERYPDIEPNDILCKKVQAELVDDASTPFSNPELRDFIIKAKQVHEQVIDTDNIDSVIYSGWKEGYSENVLKTISDFRDFIEKNKDEIDALSIIYNQQYKNRRLTEEMIKSLYEIISKPPYNWTISRLWNCYYVRDNEKINKPKEYLLTDIISIIRYELHQTDSLNPFNVSVRTKFKEWIFKRNNSQGYIFSQEQTRWLNLIRDQICSSISFDESDLDLAPFDGMGGLGKFYNLFGSSYEELLSEINIALVA